VLTTTKHNTHATLLLIRKPHSIKPLAPEPSHNLYRQYFKKLAYPSSSPIYKPFLQLPDPDLPARSQDLFQLESLRHDPHYGESSNSDDEQWSQIHWDRDNDHDTMIIPLFFLFSLFHFFLLPRY
jgi:hypothetical protein